MEVVAHEPDIKQEFVQRQLQFKPIEVSFLHTSNVYFVPRQVKRITVEIPVENIENLEENIIMEPAIVPKEVKETQIELSLPDEDNMNNNEEVIGQVKVKGDIKVEPFQSGSANYGMSIPDGRLGTGEKGNRFDTKEIQEGLALLAAVEDDAKNDDDDDDAATGAEKQPGKGPKAYERMTRKAPVRLQVHSPWAGKLERLEPKAGSLSPETVGKAQPDDGVKTGKLEPKPGLLSPYREPVGKTKTDGVKDLYSWKSTLDTSPKTQRWDERPNTSDKYSYSKPKPAPEVKSYTSSFYKFHTPDSSRKSSIEGPELKPVGSYNANAKPFEWTLRKPNTLYSYESSTEQEYSYSSGQPLFSIRRLSASSDQYPRRLSASSDQYSRERPVTPIEMTQAYAALSTGPASPLKSPEVVMHRVSDILKKDPTQKRSFQFYGEEPVSSNVRLHVQYILVYTFNMAVAIAAYIIRNWQFVLSENCYQCKL